MSRVTLEKPCKTPFLSNAAVITTFAQNCWPLLRTLQPLVLQASLLRGYHKFQFWLTFCYGFRKIEAGEVLADDLTSLVTLIRSAPLFQLTTCP